MTVLCIYKSIEGILNYCAVFVTGVSACKHPLRRIRVSRICRTTAAGGQDAAGTYNVYYMS